MKYENSRQAASFLGKVLQDESSAAMHPFIQRLPEDIREALLDPNNSLRNLLHMHEPTSSYQAETAAGQTESISVSLTATGRSIRAGPRSSDKVLFSSDFSMLASLVLRLSNISKQQLAEFHYSLTESASLEVSKQSIIDEDVVVLKLSGGCCCLGAILVLVSCGQIQTARQQVLCITHWIVIWLRTTLTMTYGK
jgi:hypothetical protein